MRTFFAPSRALAARRVEGGGHRIYDPRDRVALAAGEVLIRALAPLLRLSPPRATPKGAPALRRILALRLDRLGDLVMTLPALAQLRRLAPEAEIELGVGSWNEELARGLPFVDRLRIIDAPWAAWGRRASWRAALRAMKEVERPDLVMDFQGDLRVILLMAWTRAPLRAGFGETGGAHLLTHRGRWDETTSWYRQSMELLRTVFPSASFPRLVEPYNFLVAEDRAAAERLFAQEGLSRAARPLIGIHPSAGRAIKQWEVEKLAALADRLIEATSGTVLLTGAPADRDLVERVARRANSGVRRWASACGVRVFAAALERLDLFVTGDTGPMHLAHAVGAPNVAIFGPSDPVRYGPEGRAEDRAVVRHSLYCSPCNMIRRPPRECSTREAPECLERISVDQVLEATMRLLGKRASL